MKKIVSWILFILIVIIVVFDIYAAIVGAIDIKNQFDELVARGASGHEFLGVGLDAFIIGIILISFVGLILSIISSKIGHCHFIKAISCAIMIVFGLMLFSCFSIPYLF